MGCKNSKSAGSRPQGGEAPPSYDSIATGKAPPANPVVPGMFYVDLHEGERAQMALLSKMAARRQDTDSSLISSAYKDLVSGKIDTVTYIDRLDDACPMFLEVAAKIEAKIDDTRAESGIVPIKG